MSANIKVGDYIKSDFASWVQGTIIGEGTIGRNIGESNCWVVETPTGQQEYIFKGQEVKLIIPTRLGECQQWERK